MYIRSFAPGLLVWPIKSRRSIVMDERRARDEIYESRSWNLTRKSEFDLYVPGVINHVITCDAYLRL